MRIISVNSQSILLNEHPLAYRGSCQLCELDVSTARIKSGLVIREQFVTSETVADAGRKEQITSGTLFDWAAIITLLWTMFGAGVDAWAHWHGATDSTFFTPWHAVLYSGVVAAAIVHFGTVCFNVGRGYPLSEAIPPGYQYAMLGLGVALIGGG